MKVSEYGKLSDLVDSDDVTELEKALHLGHHNGTALGLLLLDAVENGSKRCFRLLLGHEDAIKLGGPTALGAAAREGDLEMVRALLDADVDLSRPKWQFDADEDHAIRGAMLSMNPEIMEAICSAGAVEQADAGWINEAMALGLGSRKSDRGKCLTFFGEALADRLDHDDGLSLEAGTLSKFAKRLISAKKMTPEARKAGERLAARINRESALREELIQNVVDGDFEAMFTQLESLTPDLSLRLGTELLAWVAGLSGPAGSAEPDYGWWAVERLIDLGFDLDGVDGYGRTALAYVVWLTRNREDLIRKMLDRGADINAIEIDHNMERSSIPRLLSVERHEGSI